MSGQRHLGKSLPRVLQVLHLCHSTKNDLIRGFNSFSWNKSSSFLTKPSWGRRRRVALCVALCGACDEAPSRWWAQAQGATLPCALLLHSPKHPIWGLGRGLTLGNSHLLFVGVLWNEMLWIYLHINLWLQLHTVINIFWSIIYWSLKKKDNTMLSAIVK